MIEILQYLTAFGAVFSMIFLAILIIAVVLMPIIVVFVIPKRINTILFYLESINAKLNKLK